MIVGVQWKNMRDRIRISCCLVFLGYFLNDMDFGVALLEQRFHVGSRKTQIPMEQRTAFLHGRRFKRATPYGFWFMPQGGSLFHLI